MQSTMMKKTMMSKMIMTAQTPCNTPNQHAAASTFSTQASSTSAANNNK